MTARTQPIRTLRPDLLNTQHTCEWQAQPAYFKFLEIINFPLERSVQ